MHVDMTMATKLYKYARCRIIAGTVALFVATPGLTAQISAQIMDPTGQPIEDAVVYATMLSGVVPSRPKREVSVEQINKEFVPLVSVLQSGTMVNFPNRDKVRHHVYSFSPAKTFEIKLYSGVPGKPIVFDKPGEVVLGCNIHDSMIAYMLVVDTPFYAKADKRGTAVIENLPTGDYEVYLWYPGTSASGSAKPQKIKLRANEAAALTFAFPLKLQNLVAPKPSAGK